LVIQTLQGTYLLLFDSKLGILKITYKFVFKPLWQLTIR